MVKQTYLVNNIILYPVIFPFNGHFFRWIWFSRYQNVSILDFIGAKDGGDGDNWSYKTCKAQNRHHPQTNTFSHSQKHTEELQPTDVIAVKRIMCVTYTKIALTKIPVIVVDRDK